MTTKTEDDTTGTEMARKYFAARPELLQWLRRCTADLMAIPRLRCGVRKCRRDEHCSWVRIDDQSPCCLANLSEEERAGFQLLLDTAMRHYVELAMPGRPPRTELDSAALELEWAIRFAGDPRRAVLRDFWRGQSAIDRRERSGKDTPHIAGTDINGKS